MSLRLVAVNSVFVNGLYSVENWCRVRPTVFVRKVIRRGREHKGQRAGTVGQLVIGASAGQRIEVGGQGQKTWVVRRRSICHHHHLRDTSALPQQIDPREKTTTIDSGEGNGIGAATRSSLFLSDLAVPHTPLEALVFCSAD